MKYSLAQLYQRLVLKHHDVYFGTDFDILNHGQMTTTSYLAPRSPDFQTTLAFSPSLWILFTMGGSVDI
ncbi:hypothetical protein AVEN_80873-1, partial [Araneus ventricosus]